MLCRNGIVMKMLSKVSAGKDEREAICHSGVLECDVGALLNGG